MAIWTEPITETIPLTETVVASTDLIAPIGPRVRWGGVMSGFVIAIGTLMLSGALGLAVGTTAIGDPRAATGETAAGLGMGAGIWAFITLLVSVFLGGMVSTKVTDRPDRPGPSSTGPWCGCSSRCSSSGLSRAGLVSGSRVFSAQWDP